MSEYDFYVVNAFAGEPFKGNPAGVFPDATGLSDRQMQDIARQLNLVETVFVFGSETEDVDVKLRYFTPLKELPIAGHPTIAAWVAMANHGRIAVHDQERYIQETRAGIQSVYLSTYDNRIFVRMDQPAPQFVDISESAEEIAKVFSLSSRRVVSDYPIQGVNTGLGHVIFAVDTLESLMMVQRKIQSLDNLCSRYGLQEAQIFTFETFDVSHDLHTRNICPREGLEDPACGVGSSALLAYLMKNRIHFTDDRLHLRFEQGQIVNMPGVIHVWGDRGTDDSLTLQIGGSGVVMLKGTFYA